MKKFYIFFLSLMLISCSNTKNINENKYINFKLEDIKRIYSPISMTNLEAELKPIFYEEFYNSFANKEYVPCIHIDVKNNYEELNASFYIVELYKEVDWYINGEFVRKDNKEVNIYYFEGFFWIEGYISKTKERISDHLLIDNVYDTY